MFVLGLITDGEVFAPELPADIYPGAQAPENTDGPGAPPETAAPPEPQTGADAEEPFAPPAESADFGGERHTLSFPSSGVSVTVSIDETRYEEMSEGYMFVDTSVADNSVYLEFTFLDPTYGSSAELAPDFLAPYLDEDGASVDSGAGVIGASGVSGRLLSAADGSLTYMAWLVDVPGGTLPVVISFYDDEQYGSLMSMLNTLQINEEQ
jgi:hypothetical protein